MQRGSAIALGLLLLRCLVGANAAAQSAPLLQKDAPDGHLALSLHARSTQATARVEQAAWLTLTVPLDRLAAPRLVTASAAPTPARLETSAPAVETVAEPPRPQLGLEQLRRFSELTQRTVSAALARVGVAADRARLDSLSSRARASALLPELRLRIVRNTDQALRWVPTTDDPYRITQADGAGLVLEASATFRFDRLVFTNDELAVERLRQQAAEQQAKLEARVEQALSALLRARQLTCALDPNDPARAGHLLELLEAFALLDSLTAGWFAEQAPRWGREVWGFPEAILGQCQPPAPPAPPPSARATIPVASLTDSE